MAIYNNISSAKFSKIWMDPSLSKKEVLARTGFAFPRAIEARAKTLGLPERPKESPGRKPKITDLELFAKMWKDRVYVAGIARHFHTTTTTVENTRTRVGLPKRPAGKFAGITLDEFLGRQ